MFVVSKWSLFLLAAGSFVVDVTAQTGDQCLNSPNRKVYYRPTSPPTSVPTKAPQKQPTPRPTRAPITPATTTTAATTVLQAQEQVAPPTTNAPSQQPSDHPTGIPPPSDPYCACADKSKFIENTGKVTGGGWIYLTNKTYFNCALAGGTTTECGGYNNVLGTSALNGVKANYGFNAMYRQGVPHGSTNFDVDGKNLHFHSEMRNTPHKMLEVMSDGIRARWMGLGALSTKHNTQGRKGWTFGYCFMVAVEDFGEPGYLDTWRLRVWDCTGVVNNACTLSTPGNKVDLLASTTTIEMFTSLGDRQDCLVFDTNYIPNGLTVDGVASASYVATFPLPGEKILYTRFNGTEVGELGDQHGGGNIQIHLKNKQNKFADYMQATGIPCAACPPNATALAESDNGFVTGGGWILLSETSYLKPPTCNSVTYGCPAPPPAPVTTTVSTTSATTSKTTGKGKSRQLAPPLRTFDDYRGNAFNLQATNLDDGSPCHTVDIDGIKANYGFNAKHIKGVPQGSFNFDIDGAGFHFHTYAWDAGNSEYDCLEVVCDDRYGVSMQEGAARFTGYGKVSRTMGSPPPEDAAGWVPGYRFWITTVDMGEPGYLDTIRLRIEDTVSCPGQILFDTNYNIGPVFTNADLSHAACPTWNGTDTTLNDPFCLTETCTALADFTGNSLADVFNGTQAGLDDINAKGGGNIQLHCKGGPSRRAYR